MLLNDFENYLKLHVNSFKTIGHYVGCLKKYFKEYNEFNQDNVNTYLTRYVNENKKSAFNLSLMAFKKYSDFIKTPIDFPKQKRITRKTVTSLSRDEIEKEILPYFQHMFQDYKKRMTIFRFMMLSLMRITEITTLKTEDIDFKTGRIKIKHAKGDKHRETFIHPSIKEDIYELVSNSKTELAFNISNAYITYMFIKINTELNYKKHLTPHTTRRAGAKFLRDNGIKLEQLQQILGHESLSTTGLYIISDTDEIQKSYNKIKYKKGIK